MAKIKTKFYCNECGYESSGWMGKCPACLSWNSFVEEKVEKSVSPQQTVRNDSEVVSISDITVDEEHRFATSIGELDRVLGGGVVNGSIVLISGDPGIGKSTLMLMLSGNIAKYKKVLYVSGEESLKQIKMRAQRLNINQENLLLVSETNINSVMSLVDKIKPEYLIIDSIQTMYDENIQSAPGSVSQVRETTNMLMQMAKTSGIPVFIVGHVTKDGAIAGPRILEHMVDTVLYFEGERHLTYRVLRSIKNRFGSTNEIGVFEMRDVGLCEVPNPSVALLSGRPQDSAGTAIVCTMEGTRPMLIEVQALVAQSSFQNAKRMSNGIDINRLSLLLAVMEKQAGFRLADCDVFVNVIGGIKIVEPAVDLAVVAAIMSSYKDRSIDPGIVLFGEVGLTGEIRSVNHVDKRISEALRLGFTKCVIPEGNRKSANLYMESMKRNDDSLYIFSSIKDLKNLLIK